VQAGLVQELGDLMTLVCLWYFINRVAPAVIQKLNCWSGSRLSMDAERAEICWIQLW
jgi:hypothetical protein